MANLRNTSATKSLNENEYINKLYNNAGSSQQKQLGDNYKANSQNLDTEQQNVQKQTNEYLQRTDVEAGKATGAYRANTQPRLSGGAGSQAALSQWNTRRSNVTDLQGRQQAADAEIERQRVLAGQQYAAAIKQAQADNDMERAQQLYNAAKAEEEQWLSLRKQAAQLMQTKDDYSITKSLLKPSTTDPVTGMQNSHDGSSWAEVLRNEDSLNKIYDAQMESQRQSLLSEYMKNQSDLEAARQRQLLQTDQNLNNAYVDALKGAKNYMETQTAYGQGSGTAAQAGLARDLELQQRLTDLRGLQMAADAQSGMNAYGLGQTYRDALAKANADVESKRAAALLEAAEQEEQNLIDRQKFVGTQLASGRNRYKVLGALYGLTPNQIDKLQGTGKYAKKKSSSSSTTGDWPPENEYKLTPGDEMWYRHS